METKKIELYLSPYGNDEWSGKTREEPFASLEKAKKAVRKAIQESKGCIKAEVLLLGGTYRLSETLLFDENDAPETGSVTWRAYGGEKPVISGGVPLEGWTQCENGVVKAALPESACGARVLYVNSEHREPAALPLEGMFFMDKEAYRREDWASDVKDMDESEVAKCTLRYKEGDIGPELGATDEIEAVIYQFWTEARLKITGLDEKNRALFLTKAAWRPLSWSFGYRLENTYAGLANRGRSFFSRSENAVYYSLREGESAQSIKAVVPGLKELLKIAPSSGKVKNLRFEGLTFSHTDSFMPPEGHAYAQAELGAPNAVYVENAEGCVFGHCFFHDLGACCLWLGRGCKDCAVTECDFDNIGAGAIRVGTEKLAQNKADETSHILISKNAVKNGGLCYLGSAAIWIGQCGHNTVSYNDITGAFQWAVSVGWNWSFFPIKNCRDNIIEKNHIHTLGTGVLGTHGAIYALGASPGTYIRNNLITDIRSNEWWDAGEGIILDNGCACITVENNVVCAACAGGWGCNFNCFGNLVSNNIFAYGEKFQLTRYGDAPQTPVPPPNGEVFTKNIVVWSKGPLLKETRWHSLTTCWDYNLYYNASGEEIKFLGGGFDDWKKLGLDQNSLIADPKIAFNTDGTYTLAPDSPAYAVGFEDINLDGVIRR